MGRELSSRYQGYKTTCQRSQSIRSNILFFFISWWKQLTNTTRPPHPTQMLRLFLLLIIERMTGKIHFAYLMRLINAFF